MPHISRNSWDCSFGGQYDGFTADGDCKKVMPAMCCEDANDTAASRSADRPFTTGFIDQAKPRHSDRRIHALSI